MPIREAATAIGILAVGALAVSLGVHPGVASEVALAGIVVVLLGALLRSVGRGGHEGHRRRSRRGVASDPRGRRIVTASLGSGWGVDVHLRRAVRDIAVARLGVQGLTLSRDPDQARTQLPSAVADLVVPTGRRRSETGVTPDQLERLLDELEGM